MTVTSIDWVNKIVRADDDLPIAETRNQIRAFEASEEGIVFEQIAAVTGRDAIGAQTSALTLTLINEYRLQFTAPGTYESRNGNFVGVVVEDAGIFFSRELSIAFAEVPTSGLTSQESQYLNEIHGIHGMRENEPLTVTDNLRQYGRVFQDITDDGTTTTVKRRPNAQASGAAVSSATATAEPAV